MNIDTTGPEFFVGLIVMLSVMLLGGIAFAFSGSVQF